MARILSLETSTDVCSAALYDEAKLIKEIVINQPQSHASRLAPIISDIFTDTALNIASLNAVAITSGPGSYTGLRIGTSTAKGICYSLEIPLITVLTLDVMAFQAKKIHAGNMLFCPMIDARRMEVYCKIFDNDLHSTHPVEAKVIDEESFKELLAHKKMLFFGNGAEKCKSVIKHENAYFAADIFPQASALGEFALIKFRSKEFEDLESFKPFYLKDFVAKKAQPL
jgi:tRNA threonylcarbamoyladenosine biosynthesis protein TsaB